ncbi:phosphatidylcholine transfer protein isoform X3 [Hydra vulgaris]|uniref:Phosphatidylcholine transfer protein isoform X3 n=1 Tax=Hydra vulgaris TaxID=6087 RepID=A0ABM4CTD9_HYDVU
MFADNAFEDALNELDNPILENYELYVQFSDVKIYRKIEETSGLYEYKVIGIINCDTETCQKVYMDLEYRKHWDTYVKELQEICCNDFSVIYWNVNFPFPLANRDYTYIRECKRVDIGEKQTWIILAQSYRTESIPPKPKIVRVENYRQFLIIQEHESKTRVFMHYFDNPGGSIPTWLINWAAKKGVPSFLSDMEKACYGYKQYLSNKDK